MVVSTIVLASSAAKASDGCPQDPVGEPSECGTKFGQNWAVEHTLPLVLQFGIWHGAFVPRDVTFGASVSSPSRDANVNDPNSFEPVDGFDGTQRSSSLVRTWGAELRAHGFFTQGIYAGLELALAFGGSNQGPFEVAGHEISGSMAVVQVRFLPVVGLRVPLGPLSLRTEIALGGQVRSFHQEARLSSSKTVRIAAVSGATVLEPRMILDFWTGPKTTVSAWAGLNALRFRDHAIGLAFAFHGRSFDGARR
jgi:hypothetical protein